MNKKGYNSKPKKPYSTTPDLNLDMQLFLIISQMDTNLKRSLMKLISKLNTLTKKETE